MKHQAAKCAKGLCRRSGAGRGTEVEDQELDEMKTKVTKVRNNCK